MVKLKLAFILLTLVYSSVPSYGQCETSEEVEIADNSTTEISLDISGLVNNDLSSNNSLCGVEIDFSHNNLGDLSMKLISPSGQEIELIGPVGAFGNTTNTRWDVSFVRCGDNANPDLGFDEDWSNNQAWGAFGNYDGSYFPFDGCLEDFNSGPANGIWRLVIDDNQNFDTGNFYRFSLIFCNTQGINCVDCVPTKGELNHPDIEACVGADLLSLDTLSLSLPNGFDFVNYTYSFVIHSQDSIYETSSNPDLTTYDVGNYNICGLTHRIDEISEVQLLSDNLSFSEFVDTIQGVNSPVCGELTDDCISIRIDPPPDTTFINNYLCEDEIFVFKDDTLTDYGNYNIVVEADNGCDSVFIINLLNPGINAVISNEQELNCDMPSVVLESTFSSVNVNTEYEWEIIEGNYQGSLSQENLIVLSEGIYVLNLIDFGCVSSDTVTVSEDFTLPEFNPQDDTLNCDKISVSLNSGIGSDYRSVEWSGPDNFSSSVRRPIVNVPGDYKIVATNNNGCKDSVSVNVSIDTIRPLAMITSDVPSCNDEVITISHVSIDSNFLVSWSGPGGFSSENDTVRVFESGEYTLEIFNPENGCSSFDSILINDRAEPPVFEVSVDTVDCYDISARVNTSANDNTYTYSWSGPGGFSSNLMEPLLSNSGRYIVEVTTLDGCTKSDTIRLVRIRNLPVLSLKGDSIECDPVLLTGNSDPSGLIYNWSGPGGINRDMRIIETSLPGTYYFSALTPAGCLSTDSITIYKTEILDSIDIEFIHDSLTCIDSVIDLTYKLENRINIDSSKWYYQDQLISYDSIISVRNPGDYRLELKLSDSCISAGSATIESYLEPPVINPVSDPIDCAEDSTSITLNSIEDVTVSWTGPNNYQSTDLNPIVRNVGMYYVMATNIRGCVAFDSVAVQIDTNVIDLELEYFNFGCNRDSVELSVNNALSGSDYEWSGPGGFYSEEQSPYTKQEGSYLVSVIGPNGCISSKEFDISGDYRKPNGNILGDTLTCDVSRVELISLADLPIETFSWTSPSGSMGSDSTFLSNELGLHILMIEAENTCRDTISYNLVSNEALPAYSISAQDIICGRNSVILNLEVDTSNLIYIEWNGPQGFISNELNPQISIGGIYTFEIQFSNGCVINDEIMVTEDTTPPDLNISDSYYLNCNKDSVLISTGLNSSYEMELRNSEGLLISRNAEFEINQSGEYTFYARGENNCVNQKEFNVTKNVAPPVVDFSVEEISCRRSKTQIVTEALKDTYTYSWKGPDTFSTTVQSPFVIEPGFYSVTVRDTNGCEIEVVVDVSGDFAPPIINTQDTVLNCDSSHINLYVNSTDTIISYRWFGPESFFSTDSMPSIDTSGVYTVQVFGDNGCFARDTIRVTNDQFFTSVEFQYYSYNCYSDSIKVRAIPFGDINSYSYDWDSSALLTGKRNEVIFSEGGIKTLRITDKNGCMVDTTVTLIQDSAKPAVVIDLLDTIVCDTREVPLKASIFPSGDSIILEWFAIEGEFIERTNTLSPIIRDTGIYSINVMDTRNGCTASDTIEVNSINDYSLDYDIVLKYPSCEDRNDGEINVTNLSGGEGPYYFRLVNSNRISDSTFVNLSEQIYNLQIIDRNNCISDTLLTLIDSNSLKVNLPGDTTIDRGASLELIPTVEPNRNNKIPEWTIGGNMECIDCYENIVTPINTQLYEFSVTDESGCRVRDDIIVSVRYKNPVYVPNAFTPNGDMINDIIFPYANEGVTEIQAFRIYNRSGNKVFEMKNFPPNDPNYGWNGEFRNQPLTPQVFTYSLVFIRLGRLEHKKGTITLLK